MTGVPTEADWGDYRADLDTEWAHRTFAGRTNQEMLPHFRNNPIEAAEELRWMPKAPFRYYILGFRDFLMTEEFAEPEGCDAASCFLGLVLERLEKQPDYVLPIMPELLAALRYVAENQALFHADEDIYGNFQGRLRQIEVLYAPQDASRG